MCMAMKNLLMCEKHHSEAMENMCSADQRDAVKETYILPKLPGPLDVMNTLTIKSVICNLVRDLNLGQSGPKPEWWPPFVPFQSPWKTTDFKTCELDINEDINDTLL